MVNPQEIEKIAENPETIKDNEIIKGIYKNREENENEQQSVG